MSRAVSALSTFLPCLEGDLENRSSEEISGGVLPLPSVGKAGVESVTFADRVWNVVNETETQSVTVNSASDNGARNAKAKTSRKVSR